MERVRESVRVRGRGGVESRVNPSEWQPVRQKQYRRGGFRNGETHRLGKAEDLGFLKVVPRVEGQIVRTFLFRNFPPECSDKDLMAKFQEAGPVADLFCPRKRDALGKRFGFVRMVLEKEEEVGEMLHKINNLWLGTYKVRALIPQYGRKETKKKAADSGSATAAIDTKSIETEVPRRKPATLVEEGRSFAQAVKGCGCPSIGRQESKKEFIFIPTEEENCWLEKARVGRLKKEFTWEENGEEIQEEAQGKLVVKTLGEDLILINPSNEDEDTQCPEEEWEKFWFMWVRAWKPEDVCQRRAVWTNWYGVPMHAWSERFFKQISLRFGAFIEWDYNTKNKISLDRARIKIWGYLSKNINETVMVSINRNVFPVRIIEEAPWEESLDGPVSDASSVNSDALPGKAMWAGREQELEDASDEGKIMQDPMMSLEIHEVSTPKVVAGAEVTRVGIGRVGINSDVEEKAAGRVGFKSGGTAVIKEIFGDFNNQIGLEEYGPEQIDELTQRSSPIQILKEIERGEFAIENENWADDQAHFEEAQVQLSDGGYRFHQGGVRSLCSQRRKKESRAQNS